VVEAEEPKPDDDSPVADAVATEPELDVPDELDEPDEPAVDDE